MNRVLIVTGSQVTGERLQQAFSMNGFQTAVVWNPMQMVEFCRQHTPDFMVVDLDLADYGLWSGIQAVKGIGTLANIPYWGVSTTGDATVLEKARQVGFCGVFPAEEPLEIFVEAVRSSAVAPVSPMQPTISEDTVSRDPALNRLRELGRCIVETSAMLQPYVGEFGEDGLEIFGYITSSGAAIRNKLQETADFSLHDKDLRHDFRNMIGSVTGFSELILMEGGLSASPTANLTKLREWSTEFVHILDQQKVEATR